MKRSLPLAFEIDFGLLKHSLTNLNVDSAVGLLDVANEQSGAGITRRQRNVPVNLSPSLPVCPAVSPPAALDATSFLVFSFTAAGADDEPVLSLVGGLSTPMPSFAVNKGIKGTAHELSCFNRVGDVIQRDKGARGVDDGQGSGCNLQKECTSAVLHGPRTRERVPLLRVDSPFAAGSRIKGLQRQREPSVVRDEMDGQLSERCTERVCDQSPTIHASPQLSTRSSALFFAYSAMTTHRAGPELASRTSDHLWQVANDGRASVLGRGCYLVKHLAQDSSRLKTSRSVLLDVNHKVQTLHHRSSFQTLSWTLFVHTT